MRGMGYRFLKVLLAPRPSADTCILRLGRVVLFLIFAYPRQKQYEVDCAYPTENLALRDMLGFDNIVRDLVLD